MNPMADFTWEWIIERLEQNIQYLTQVIEQGPEGSHQTQEGYRRSDEGLLLAIPELRGHPQLTRNVPMISLSSLRWFPRTGYEVMVFYDQQKLHYKVTIFRVNTSNSSKPYTLIEEAHPHLSKLPDTVVEFIKKAKQLPAI